MTLISLLLCILHLLATPNPISEMPQYETVTPSQLETSAYTELQLPQVQSTTDNLKTLRHMLNTEEKSVVTLATDNNLDSPHGDITGLEFYFSAAVPSIHKGTSVGNLKSDMMSNTHFYQTEVDHRSTANLENMSAVDGILREDTWRQTDTETLTNTENEDTNIELTNNMEVVSASSMETVADNLDLKTVRNRTTFNTQQYNTIQSTHPTGLVKSFAHVNGLELIRTVNQRNKNKFTGTYADTQLDSSTVKHSNLDTFDISNQTHRHSPRMDQSHDTFSNEREKNGTEGISHKLFSAVTMNTHAQNSAGDPEERTGADNTTVILNTKRALGIRTSQSTVIPNCRDVNDVLSPLRSSKVICLIVLWILAMTAAVFLGLTIFLWVRLSVQKERRRSGGLRETAKGVEIGSLWTAQKLSVEERVEFWYANGETMEYDNRRIDRGKIRHKENGRRGETESLWTQPRVTLDDITDFWYANGRALPETQV